MSKLSKEYIKFRNAVTQRFINLRVESGFSQSEFAKIHELDRQQVNRWENFKSERGVSIYTIRKFCILLDVSISEFFNDPVFEGM